MAKKGTSRKPKKTSRAKVAKRRRPAVPILHEVDEEDEDDGDAYLGGNDSKAEAK